MLCVDIKSLWNIESFSDYYFEKYESNCIATIATSSSVELPSTKRLVRGCKGNEIRIYKNNKKSLEQRIKSLLFHSYRVEEYYSEVIQDRITKINETVNQIGILIDNDPELGYRLSGSIGYKSFSSEEFYEMKKKGDWSGPTIYFMSIADLIAKELVGQGFELSEKSRFDKWDSVCIKTFEKLSQLKLEDEYHYEVLIFLNGPLIDYEEDVIIANLALQGKPIKILLGYAVDEIMTPLVEYAQHPAIDKINTVIKYRVNIPIEAGEDDYLVQYHNASLVAQLLLDSLRLCRPIDDIGVLAIEVVPISFTAPVIRKTWANQFQSELARFEPRRFDFSPASPLPLSEKEIERIKGITSLMLPDDDLPWNLQYAMRRFRNSIERYSVDDAERLLEYAIALESLYLNDNSSERGELTYRLSLRAARLLAKDFEKRKKIFDFVKKLYGFRSRIAHGEDISRLKKAKDDELKEILKHIPILVAESIIKLMLVWRTSPGIQFSDFWKEVELSDPYQDSD